MKRVIGQQGEVRIIQIDVLPENIQTTTVEKTEYGFIISHSESGHHHVVADGEVMERVTGVPEGMKIFYAIVNNPTEFKQTAANPHGKYDLGPGIYEFRVSREFNPFLKEARRVQD